MSLQRPTVPKADHATATTQPTSMSQIVLRICKDNDKAIARSMEELKAFDLNFGKLTDAFLELEDSDVAEIATFVSQFQLMIDRMLEVKTREAIASKVSLQAFQEKMVIEPIDSTLVEMFTRVLNNASPDAIVRDVLNDFATNFISMGMSQQKIQEQASANPDMAAPTSESMVANPENNRPALSTSTKSAAKKQTEVARSTKSDNPVAAAARPPKGKTRDHKSLQSVTSASPSDTTSTLTGRVPLNNTTNRKQPREAVSTGFNFEAANKKVKIRTRTYLSKAQTTTEKQQAQKRSSKRALPSLSLGVETAQSTARAEKDSHEAIKGNHEATKDTVVKAAKKESDRTVAKPALLDDFGHRSAVLPNGNVQQSAVEHVSEDSVSPDSITSEATTDVQSTQRTTTPEQAELRSQQAFPELQTHTQSASTLEDREKTPLDTVEGGPASHADTDMTSPESTTHSMANNNTLVEDIDTKTVNAHVGEDVASTEVEIQPTAGVSQSTDIAVNHDTIEEDSVIIEDAPIPAEEVKVNSSKANNVRPVKTKPERTTALPGRKGFLTIGMPGVCRPVRKQTPAPKKSSSKKMIGNAQKKRYKSAETVVDDEGSDEDNGNSKAPRTSKPKKSASDKKNSEASQNSNSKKITSDNTPETPDLVTNEGLELRNIVWEPRRKRTGRAFTPQSHSRSSESTDGDERKRKRGMDDSSLPNKKVAVEGRYIARSKACRTLPTSDDGSMDIDCPPAPSTPVTLVDNAPSSRTLDVSGLGATDWDDDAF